MPVAPEDPVTRLSGVGPALAARLEKLGVRTVQDLVLLLPARYEDRTRVLPIGALRPGQRAVIEGEVLLTEVVRRRRPMLVVAFGDTTGMLTLRFFHFNARQQESLARGTRLRCFGEVRAGQRGLEIVHPEYQRADGPGGTEDEALTPVYPGTEGLTQARLRQLVRMAMRALGDSLPELLPPGALAGRGLPSLDDALRLLHHPPPDADLAALEGGSHPARRRLALEELLAHQLAMRALRHQARRKPAWPLPGGPLVERFIDSLPFTLTGAQRRVVAEVRRDLAAREPMMRLVQGDVGSGKTVVAAVAALQAVASGAQAAIMAPTELLAEQHYTNFRAWLEPLGVDVAWLSGSLPAAQRRDACARIASGEAAVAVGTHALFQEGVEFARLALAVIDEQHRFGVHQRLALTDKGTRAGRRPHQLVMTATPIPRTLAMATYADLDTSVIDELPPGRGEVRTVAMPESRRAEVITRIREACAAGRQAYWVCPLVEESDQLQAQAAEDTATLLAETLPELAIGLVHGRMKPAGKEQVMRAFKAGEIQLLVATTVIEVGVDVPRASLMIIENAERMGLAQLHQLRGRVGRGSDDSSCVLLYKPPLSPAATTRLAAMRETNDGFRIARTDLELRGPGEVLGVRQTGLLALKVADLARDAALMPQVRELADALLQRHPETVAGLERRWIGAATRYGQV
ncbi:ATP-dependent DNA helicase RecG [Thioalkalivibrio sp. XN279]|uniref:ATP-dependent DNA helicase RecG n=1 Tax=Thioalkalivibrio sp. XN279 TaxID=2714953 RepID=UPI001407A019|nr:ATP-dependent DNA helicase RecG [Thioalkalivibrio sp. XN279]